jgi:hypothetical protein
MLDSAGGGDIILVKILGETKLLPGGNQSQKEDSRSSKRSGF